MADDTHKVEKTDEEWRAELSPEDYAANIAREEAKWAAVAKKLGVGPN